MLYNFQRKKLCRHLLVGGVLCAVGLGIPSCSDTYDLDTEQPSGLNSIYGYMEQQGKYTQYLRLVEDLGQKEILSMTGSKTMFIADDDAFAKFFQSNKWGVKNYEQLSLAQKKLLLNTAMIDNPYSTSMLSTAAGSASPIKGEVCRRSSSTSLFDSVLVVTKTGAQDVVPANNSRFKEVLANHDTLVIFTDASNAAPMLHFTAKFLSANKLESSDIDFLYNQPAGTRQPDDVYVNNAKIVEPNIFCKNGFIHQVDQVIMPLDNMAEVIRQHPNMSLFSSIVERFAALSDSTALTDAYNVNKGTDVDSVFVKRYFSNRSAGSVQGSDRAFSKDKNGNTFDASLKFDPGWNAYNSGIAGKGDNDFMEDMGVMLVPSNEALEKWWNEEAADIKEFYGTLDETPNLTLSKLVNVNMLSSFVGSVPSVFVDVKDDAQEAMGITVEDVDSVFLACNGVVYLTNKVFAPKSYVSVLSPTQIDTLNFRKIEYAIDRLDYSSYLNSMVAKYIFIIPTNDGLLSYVDPVSYGQMTINNEGNMVGDLQMWEFGYDATKGTNTKMNANVYKCVLNPDGSWEKGDKVSSANPTLKDLDMKSSATSSAGVMHNRFTDMLDNIIVTEGYRSDKKYYKTKGNAFVRIDGITEGSNVYGTWQYNRNQPLAVKRAYNKENGVALVVDGPLMGTNKSVAMTLAEHEEFSEFLEVLKSCGALSKTGGTYSNKTFPWQAGDQTYGNLFSTHKKGEVGGEDATSDYKSTYLLNNYHYTIYAPTNEAMQQAYNMGLPTLDDLKDAEEWDGEFSDMSPEEQDAYVKEHGTCKGDSAARIQEALLDFVKYHIQDNSIFVDNGFEAGAYESGKTELRASTNVAEEGKYTKDGANSITIEGKSYQVKQWLEDNSVEYYTGLYSPARPYKINVKDVSSGGLTISDVEGHERHVLLRDGLYNLMAREYWYESSSAVKNPYQTTLNNSSSVVIHAIDGPLLYDSPGQFKYVHKPLTQVTD